VEVPSIRKPVPASSGVLKDGDKVAFRVLESLPGNRYLVQVRHKPMSVQSRFPLEEGGRYLAEVKIHRGLIQFLSRPIPENAVDALLAQRQTLKTPLSSLLRTLMSQDCLPSGFLTDGRSAEGIRASLLNCGLFYEARVREALRKRGPHALGEDVKGFLLRQAEKHPVASIRDTIRAALKQVEVKQLLCLQGGPEGPLPFWLPFAEDTVIEGSLKRFRRSRNTEYLVMIRVPFLPAEELLVAVKWNPKKVEVHFSAGPLAFKALRSGVPRLEQQLSDMGFHTASVRVSRGLPKRLREAMEGIRFVESYG
jgi:hypothetical protein